MLLPPFVLLHRFDGDANDWLGWSVSGAGDVNGDGYADVIVGAPLDDDNGPSSGTARVYSGLDGSTLHVFRGDSTGDEFGTAVCGAGDVDGDGYADLVVGAYADDPHGSNSGSVRVFSGFDGSTLHTFSGDSPSDFLGYSVHGAGDVNGDGYADVIAGAIGDDNRSTESGSARVFSGLDGSVLFTFNGDLSFEEFGEAVSGAGDVNADGFDDLIVGASARQLISSGSARVFSGFDGSLLYKFNGDSTGDRLGFSVSGAGDVNGDGFADVVAGAPSDDDNGGSSGSARVYSGFDGSVLYTFRGVAAADQLGFSVSGAGDVDGDGRADVVVGAVENIGVSAGRARVYSGSDGSVLQTFVGASPREQFGFSVSGAGDVDRDGFADIVVGAVDNDDHGTDSGSARVFASQVPDTMPPTIACPGDVTVEAGPTGAAIVAYSLPTSADDRDLHPDVVCVPPPGSSFTPGATTVTCTAIDDAGNAAACSFVVTVLNPVPPTVACRVSRSVLFPASNGLVDAGFARSATDAVTPNPAIEVRVYSDEPNGSPPYAPDATLTATLLRLRAERSGASDGRVYLVVVSARDAAGNVGFQCATSVVPLNATVSQIASVNAQAAVAEAWCRAHAGAPPPAYATLLAPPP